MKYVPDWFPGANFKRIGRYYREATSRMINAPVEFVQRELVSEPLVISIGGLLF